MFLPTFSMVTETPDGWMVGVNSVSLVFGRAVVLPAEWTAFIPKAAPRFCIEYSADCSDERRVVEGSIFCATHLAQISGEYRIDYEARLNTLAEPATDTQTAEQTARALDAGRAAIAKYDAMNEKLRQEREATEGGAR